MDDINRLNSAGAAFAAVAISSLLIAKISSKQTKAKAQSLEEKFKPKDGITFYYFSRSPCARRVWLTIIEKGVKCNLVMVNLTLGEQRHPAYLKINSQGKVPAIVVKNYPGVPDCILYESQAIVEWLDEMFPETPLYPTKLIDRTTVKMWQYFELVLAEEIWPLSRQQVDGVIWRFMFNRHDFFKIGPPSQTSDDLYYKEKVSQIYDGSYLTIEQCKRSLIRILHGFKLLEDAVGSKDGQYIMGNQFTQADIAAYPRLVKMPQNGIVTTARERALFPNVLAYFEDLRKRPSFAKFKVDDMKIWESGYYPKFVPQWWGRFLPWWFVIAVGKYRSGVKNFERINQAYMGQEAILNALRSVGDSSLKAIPATSSQQSGNMPILYLHKSLPLSIAVEMCIDAIGYKCRKIYLDVLHLENYRDDYLQVMPFGEIPALESPEKIVYGPHLIIEYIQSTFMSSTSVASTLTSLDELTTVQRAVARRWFGWARTAWHYQLKHVWNLSQGLDLRRQHSDSACLLAAVRSAIRPDGAAIRPHSPAAEAIDELLEVYDAAATLTIADLSPYIDELKQRLDYLESELAFVAETSPLPFLTGDKPTYADIFVLVVILQSEEAVAALAALDSAKYSPLAASKLPLIQSWKGRLLAKPSLPSLSKANEEISKSPAIDGEACVGVVTPPTIVEANAAGDDFPVEVEPFVPLTPDSTVQSTNRIVAPIVDGAGSFGTPPVMPTEEIEMNTTAGGLQAEVYSAAVIPEITSMGPKILVVGDLVERNVDHWSRGDEDGGVGSYGLVTLVMEASKGLVTVKWRATGKTKVHAYGKDAKYEIRAVDSSTVGDNDSIGSPTGSK